MINKRLKPIDIIEKSRELYNKYPKKYINYIKYIKKQVDNPLSSIDIQKILNGKVKVLLYPEIVDYYSIDELLYPYDKVVILYMHNKLVNGFYGHWCCIFKINNKEIEFFDPYGIFPDDQLNTSMNEHFRIENGLEYPLLTYLLYYTSHNYKLSYNHIKFQGEDSSTCGRHCCWRLKFSDRSLNSYKDMLDYDKSFKILDLKSNYDNIVTIFTDYLLK